MKFMDGSKDGGMNNNARMRKPWKWAKHVLEAIVPSLVVHQGYDAKGPKDLPLAKTFGIWLQRMTV